MTRDQLAEIGKAIYGQNWKSPMAKDLGVKYRTVLRWVAGEFAIPEDIQDRLKKALKLRAEEAQRTATKLGKIKL